MMHAVKYYGIQIVLVFFGLGMMADAFGNAAPNEGACGSLMQEDCKRNRDGDFCKWDEFRGCVPKRCFEIRDQMSCRARNRSMGCQWLIEAQARADQKVGLCMDQCVYRYFSQEECQKDSNCLWRNHKCHYQPMQCRVVYKDQSSRTVCQRVVDLFGYKSQRSVVPTEHND